MSTGRAEMLAAIGIVEEAHTTEPLGTEYQTCPRCNGHAVIPLLDEETDQAQRELRAEARAAEWPDLRARAMSE